MCMTHVISNLSSSLNLIGSVKFSVEIGFTQEMYQTHLQQRLPSLIDNALWVNWVWTARLMDSHATCLYNLRGRDFTNTNLLKKQG